MNNRAPVPGLYCILDDDLTKIAAGIEQCQQQNLDDYVKFKMFGKPELDLSIVKLARAALGDDAFILSDANRGYKNWKTIDELAKPAKQPARARPERDGRPGRTHQRPVDCAARPDR